MAYVKQTWKSGDVVTSEKLNRMEGGIEAGGLPIVPTTQDGDNFVSTKTYAEIKAMLDESAIVVAITQYQEAGGLVRMCVPIYGYMDGENVHMLADFSGKTITVQSVNDYPIIASKA